MRRKLTIVLWIIAACVIEFSSSLGVLDALAHFNEKLLIKLENAVPDIVFLFIVFIVGPLVAMGFVGYLGLVGRLPGTRFPNAESPPPSGFPVVRITRSAEGD